MRVVNVRVNHRDGQFATSLFLLPVAPDNVVLQLLREQLGGFFLINAEDIDEAINIAAQIPGAQFGTVEIRPVIEVAGLPENS